MTKDTQSGILNRPPEHVLLFALRFLPGLDAAACHQAMDLLRDVERRELRSDIDSIEATTDKTLPFPETGELGYVDGFNRSFLTITTGLSARAMDRLGVPADQRPADLVEVPWADMGLQPTVADPGDVLIQVCSDSPYVAEHAQRRIELALTDSAETVWAVRGDQRFTSRQGRVNAGEARALIGFHDGTSNLDPAHSEEDHRLVFVDPSPEALATYPPTPPAGPQPPPQPGEPGYGSGAQGPIFPPMRPAPDHEPPWCKLGTYCFVQAITMDLRPWDHSALVSQEQIIGRFKRSGASLDLTDDDSRRKEEPAFVANPALETVGVASHARKVTREPYRTTSTDACSAAAIPSSSAMGPGLPSAAYCSCPFRGAPAPRSSSSSRAGCSIRTSPAPAPETTPSSPSSRPPCVGATTSYRACCAATIRRRGFCLPPHDKDHANPAHLYDTDGTKRDQSALPQGAVSPPSPQVTWRDGRCGHSPSGPMRDNRPSRVLATSAA